MKRKKIGVHLICIVVIFIIACFYFSPVLDGKSLMQGDQQSSGAMIAETCGFARETSIYVDWLSSMFSGMPSYQTGAGTPTPELLKRICVYVCSLHSIDLGVFFFYMIGFYVALICLGISPLLALFGAVGFGLGSYNLIIIHAGHITKARCIALMLPVFAGMLLCLKGARGKRENKDKGIRMMVGGGILFSVALMLQISFSHIQISYYTMLGAIAIVLTYFVFALKEKWMKPFLFVMLIFGIGVIFTLACNARLLFATQEYAKYTMRGGSEITVTPESLYNDNEPKSDYTSTGLSMDYAYSWSYGIGETYTLLVPGARGGGSGERVDKESASYKNFRQTRAPLYWGDQPFTDGPVYFGAIIIFLFIFGLFVVRGPERWWLLIATILSIMLAWGRHFMPFNEWMFNYLPLYNKFRTPSMALTLANVTMVFMAVLALKAVIDNQTLPKKGQRNMVKPLYISGGITVCILLAGLILSGELSYSGVADDQMAAQYKDQWSFIQNVFIQDRKALFVSDSWRSLLFVALAFVILWLYINNKLKKAWMAVAPMTLLVLIDLWGVDRRYIAKEDFVKPRDLELRPESYDAEIDQQAAFFGDVDYRVLNLAVNTFNDAKPSAFHHQIGGYSAVKLRRYQDIIDFYISRHINWRVLDMLNARYIVTPDRKVQRNPEALGNCWFVENYQFVSDPNGEILALNDFDPLKTAIVDSSKWSAQLVGFTPAEASVKDSIVEDYQTPYHPGYLRYNSHCENDRLAVFSEVFYYPDWFVYIDGKRADYFRANYILRAMVVPAGDHVIEFRNEAPLVHKLNKVTLISQIIFLVVIAIVVAGYYVWSRRNRQNNRS